MPLANNGLELVMREYPKSDIVRILEVSRMALKDVGKELTQKGILLEEEDIFFLHQRDILDYLEYDNNKSIIREKVVQNKQNYYREMGRTRIPRMLLNNGAIYYTSTVIEKDSKLIKGMALSPGAYEGKVRVVYEPLKIELKKGEILVIETTNPAWIPLFAIAGALIMEYGGPMSHGGIVVREYGIPAVVRISTTTTILKDGQKVRVNGGAGTIEIIED